MMTLLMYKIIEPLLTYPFLQRAVVVCILSSIICALMGVVLMSGKTSFLGDALSHGMLPGIALGVSTGGAWWGVSLLGAASGMVLTGVALWASKHRALDMNSSIAGIYLIAIALSMFLGGSEDLMHAFFGSILTVPQSYVYALVGCCAVSLIFTYYFFEALIIHSFDSDFARRAFHYMGWIFKGWLTLFVINAAVQFQGIGALVVLGLTILPFLSFYTAGVHIRHILWRSIAWNLVASGISLLLSCHKDWPYGPTLLLLLGMGYAGALVYSRIALPHLWRTILILGAFNGISLAEPPNIMTSSYLLKHIVTKLLPSSDRIKAISKQSCLHYQPESAQHLIQLSKADMIILHGKGIDIHWIKFLESAGINLPVVVLSDLLPASYPLYSTSCNRIDGHVWHNPLYVVQYVKILESILAKRYPKWASKIRTASLVYQKELHTLDQGVGSQWKQSSAKAGLVAHDGLFYYQQRYHVTLYPVPEDQQHQGRYLTKLMKCPVRAVFPEHGHHDTVCRQWAKDLAIIVGTPLYIDDLPEGMSYVQMMNHNTKALRQGLVVPS